MCAFEIWIRGGRRPQKENHEFHQKNLIGLKIMISKCIFCFRKLVSTIIHYPSIDPRKSLETYVSPCTYEFMPFLSIQYKSFRNKLVENSLRSPKEIHIGKYNRKWKNFKKSTYVHGRFCQKNLTFLWNPYLWFGCAGPGFRDPVMGYPIF